MKRSFLILMCVLLTVVFVLSFASCTEEETPVHTHTYDSTWTYDVTGHWYAANCEHTNEKANFAKHTDANNDGICDICTFVECEHTYAEAWSSDAENHWNAATCGCNVKGNVAAHVGMEDGICDTCTYGEHDHTASKEWKTDAENHWNLSSCEGHDAVEVNKAAHADENKDGLCDACAYAVCDHEWATAWTSDETGHWHAAVCDKCTAAKNDFAAHADENKDGNCDVCEFVVCSHNYSIVWSKNETEHWNEATCGCIVRGNVGEHTPDDKGQCTVCKYENHDHTYSEEFVGQDETHHWREATCGCTMIKDRAEHTGRQDDGVCDACGYGAHDHTWGEYKYNATEHYKETTCAHHNAIKGYAAAHTDVNNDSLCDTCHYDFGHTHTYDANAPLASDEKGHWVAPTCGHDVRINYADHNEFGVDFKCSTCGKYTLKGILLEIADADTVKKVSDGTVVIDGYGVIQNISYEFGTDYTHIIDDGTESFFEYWHHLLPNGNIFSLRHYIYGVHYANDEYDWSEPEDYGIQKYEEATVADMAGYTFNLGFISWMIENPGYGVEGLIKEIYNYALTSEDVTGNIESTIDTEKNEYTFKYYSLSGDTEYGSLKIMTVDFTTNDEKVVTSVTVDYTTYYDVTGDPTKLEGADYYLDENGEATLLDGATPDDTYSMIIEQNVGERDAVSPYDPAEILIGSYDLVDAEGNVIGEGYKHEMGNEIAVTLSNINPTTADIALDTPTLNVKVDNKELSWFWPSWNEETGTFSFSPTKTGMWELAITTSSGETNYFYIEVVNPQTTELKPVVNGEETNAAEIYAGKNFTLTANAQNSYADANFTATCDDANLTLTLDEDYNGTRYNASSTVPGTYTITLTSTSNPDVTATVTITIIEAPDVKPNGIYEGYYEDWDWNSYEVTATFTPDSEGACTGIVVVNTKYQPNGGWWGPTPDPEYYDTTYTYNGAGAGLALTYVSGDENSPIEITLTNDLEVAFITPDGEVTAFEAPIIIDPNAPTVEDILNGTHVGTLSYGTVNYNISVTFNPTTGTSGTFDVVVEWSETNPRGYYKHESTYSYSYDKSSDYLDRTLVKGALYSTTDGETWTPVADASEKSPITVAFVLDTMTVEARYMPENSLKIIKAPLTQLGGDVNVVDTVWQGEGGSMLAFDYCELMVMDGYSQNIAYFDYSVSGNVITFTVTGGDVIAGFETGVTAVVEDDVLTLTLNNGTVIVYSPFSY